MQVGLNGSKKIIVTEDNTAISYGSGDIAVFATPAMISLMENTALDFVSPYLDEGMTTVGINVNVKHLSATPVGAKVLCSATLVKIDGKRLTFDVQAFDDAGLIGSGTHERFIVRRDNFLDKCMQKFNSI